MKRLRILWAALTQRWSVFTCPRCQVESYISGHAPDVSGLLCQDCEAKDFEKWIEDFKRRDARQTRSA